MAPSDHAPAFGGSETYQAGAPIRPRAAVRAPLAFRSAFWLIAQNWTRGALTFITPGGARLEIVGQAEGPHAVVQIHRYRFIRRVLAAGAIGFAEGYMAGEWDSPDIAATLTAFALNFDRLNRVTLGNPLVGAANFLEHLMRPNSRVGSRRNIHAHYDLGNAFYASWLDPGMTYSSALFDDPGQSLSAAQMNKYRALCEAMDLRAEHHVLEIGCGWGGFAEYAAGTVGARVTAITISREQYDYAQQRLAQRGLSERVELQLIDYRDVGGAFDRVASIEMFEAVGEQYWPAYFRKVHDVLRPGGRAALQIITIQDELFAGYRRRADFIQKYVFPGGMLAAEGLLRQVTGQAGLTWSGVRRFGRDYADTLAAWLRRFDGAWGDIQRLGFDDRFRRLWRFYLAYCEAGFRTGRTDVIQLGLRRA